MDPKAELRAQSTVAGACAHLAKDNHADAVNLINLYIKSLSEPKQA